MYSTVYNTVQCLHRCIHYYTCVCTVGYNAYTTVFIIIHDCVPVFTVLCTDTNVTVFVALLVHSTVYLTIQHCMHYYCILCTLQYSALHTCTQHYIFNCRSIKLLAQLLTSQTFNKQSLSCQCNTILRWFCCFFVLSVKFKLWHCNNQ